VAAKRFATILSAVVAALVTLPLAGAAGADLDGTFAGDGTALTDFGATDQAFAVAVQRDAKIVAAGSTAGNFALARYSRDGTLDQSFGREGRVVTDFGGDDYAADIAVQQDGKLVVAGRAGGSHAVARYLPNGDLDPSFGRNGLVTVKFFEGSFLRVHVRRDGRIVAVGYQVLPSDDAQHAGFVLARFRPDGSSDPSFENGGRLITPVRPRTRPPHAAFAADGKIVVAATYVDPRNRSDADPFPIEAIVMRYRADGKLDRTFGGDGVVTRRLRRGDCCVVGAVAVQRNGSVVIGGYARQGAAAFARLRPNGAFDGTFGRRGQAVSTAGAGVRALVVDGRNRIIAALALGGRSRSDFAVIRLGADGSADRRFGTMTTDFGAQDEAWDLALQQDGKVVVGGYSGVSLGQDPPRDFAVARYRASAS
jgi:uncharacterized delta-60 repeat protein